MRGRSSGKREALSHPIYRERRALGRSLPSVLMLCLGLAFLPCASAQVSVPHSVVGQGGGVAASSHHRLQATVGQPLAARGTALKNGFWYVARADRSTDVGVDEPAGPALAKHRLFPNYPNPFTASTHVPYELASGSRVHLAVHDVLGRSIRTLIDSQQPAGRYSAVWDGRNSAGRRVSAGFYLYTLRAGSFSQTRSMLLIR